VPLSSTTVSSTTTTATTTATTTGRPTANELFAEIVSATSSASASGFGSEQQQQQQQQAASILVQSIVIGGEGEPLLRFNALLSLIQQIKNHFSTTTSSSSSSSSTNSNSTITTAARSSTTIALPSPSPIPMPITPKIRLTTNGLVDPTNAATCTQQLRAAGLDAVSVALMTHDAQQYQDLMMPLSVPLLLRPLRPLQQEQQQQDDRMGVPPPASSSFAPDPTTTTTTTTTTSSSTIVPPYLDWVCHFCRAAVQAGLDVELTAIDRPDVDKAATEKLALQLLFLHNGRPVVEQEPSSSVVRWRPYFFHEPNF
jgi:hypothetical protein